MVKGNYWMEKFMIDVAANCVNNVVVLDIKGQFYLESIPDVESVWKTQIAMDPKVMALNCSELTGVDSSAIGTMVHFLNSAMENKIELVFYDLNPSIQKLFRTAHLDSFFTITTKEEFENKYANQCVTS